MPVEASLLEILACPACHAPLREESTAAGGEDGAAAGGEDGSGPDTELVCTGSGCGLAYPVRDEIPVLLVDEARRPA